MANPDLQHDPGMIIGFPTDNPSLPLLQIVPSDVLKNGF
jgi:hypothetical protein